MQCTAQKLSESMLIALEVAVEFWLALTWSPQAQWLSASDSSSVLQDEVSLCIPFNAVFGFLHNTMLTIFITSYHCLPHKIHGKFVFADHLVALMHCTICQSKALRSCRGIPSSLKYM